MRMGGEKSALLLLGRCLSLDGSQGAVRSLRQDLAAADRDWCPIVAVANRHQIAPALWLSLCRKECERALPSDLQRYLSEIFQRNARRNTLLRQQACEAVAALNRAGIQPIVLKGGLQLFDPGFDRAARIMADLDFLTPRAGFETAVDALRGIGYSVLATAADRLDYSLTLARGGVLATIDLHRDLGPQRTLLSADAAVSAAEPLSVEGIELLSLCPTHRILHAIVNVSVNDPHYRMARIALCRLYELALLSRHRSTAIDWSAVRLGMKNEGLEHVVPALFHLTRQLFDVALPPEIRPTRRARVYAERYWLQTRYAPLRSIGRLWGRFTHTFSRVRVDYFYPCGHNPLRLMVSRFHHARTILHRRDTDIVEAISGCIRSD